MTNMKRISSIIAILAAILISGCKPENYKPVGKLESPTASLAGTWKITSVTQKDEDAANKGFPYQTADLTQVFPYTDFILTLNMNGTTPTTFTTTPGNSPLIINLASGNWIVDDPSYPKVLTLISGTDSATVTLGSYPTGPNTSLKITQAKRDASSGKLLISYSYVFSKQ
jgi:hypothetical protein